MIHWLAQQTADPFGGNILLQYGAIGFLALAGIWATIYLYRGSQRQHELEREQWRAALQASNERADRMEKELLGLHTKISGELAGKLVESTGSMKDFGESMKEVADAMKRQGDR